MSINLGTEANKVDKTIIGRLSKLGLSNSDFDTNFTISGKDRPDVGIKDKFGKFCIIFENKKDFKDLSGAKNQGLKYLEQLKEKGLLSENCLLIITNISVFYADEYKIIGNDIVRQKEIRIDTLEDINMEFIKKYSHPEKKEEEKKLLSRDKTELKKMFDRINNYLRDSGLDISLRLHITSAMLFLKLIKENDDLFDNIKEKEKEKEKLRNNLSNLENSITETNIISVFEAINDLYSSEFRFELEKYKGVVAIQKSLKNKEDLGNEKDKKQDTMLIGLYKIIKETHLSGYDLDIKGEAFEYFINYGNTGSDMGEYFTPRHIVRFMVRLLDKVFVSNRERLADHTYFDPTCGTGGFLIEIFKQVQEELKKHNNINDQTIEKLKKNTLRGNELNLRSSEIAKMNMILTGDGHTNIRQGDFIAYIPEIAKKYDVSIGNPPFGNNREREFVDGFLRVVKPGGYAIFLVPEGVLFKSDKNFMAVRQNLLNKGRLLKVISLPSGSFLPYTGVKTDIIFWQNEEQATNYDIEFIDIKNDGLSLDMNRRELQNSDLEDYFHDKQSLIDKGQVRTVNSSQIYDQKKLNELELEKSKLDLANKTLKSKIETIKNNIKKADNQAEKDVLTTRLVEIQKEFDDTKNQIKKISDKLKSFDLSLVVGRYKPMKSINKNIKVVNLSDICDIKTGKKDVNQGNPNGEYPFFTCAKEITYSDGYSFDTEALLIAGNGDVGDIKYYKGKFEAYQRTYILDNFKNVLPMYLYFCLKNKLKETTVAEKQGTTMPYIKLGTLQNFQLPLPSLERQQEIVQKIVNYEKIINGARQVIETYKPEIEIKDEWEMVEIKDIVEFDPQKNEVKEFDQKTKISFVPMQIVKEHQKYFQPQEEKTIEEVYKGYTYFKDNDVLLAKITPCFENGKSGIVKNLTNGIGFGSTEYFVLRPNENVLSDWIYYFISNEKFLKDGKIFMSGSAGQQRVNKEYVLNTKFPLPPLAEQETIVAELEEQQKLIDANKKLIEIFTDKIKQVVEKIWNGE